MLPVARMRRVASLISSAAFATSNTASNPMRRSASSTRSWSSRWLYWPYRLGGGRATVYSSSFSTSSASLTARFAWCGQMRMHSPQSMQRSARMCAFPSRTRMASVGQRLMQLMHPVHSSFCSVTE